MKELSVVQNPSQPSINLKWEPPPNFSNPQEVIHYNIKISRTSNNKLIKEMEVSGEETTVELSGKDTLEPLLEYTFAVQAKGHNHILGGWSEIQSYISKYRK